MMRGTFNPDSGFATQGNDEKVIAQFYIKAEIDGVKSREQGHPVKQDITFLRIIQPGESRLSTIDRPATDFDVARFPRQWEAFKRGKAEGFEGAPLSLLFPDNPAIPENMKHSGVHTVEQLAGLSDTALQEIGMGARQWQVLARAYLAKAEGGKDFHAITARLDQLELKKVEDAARIEALETALARATQDTPEKRGPGRPRKEEAA